MKGEQCFMKKQTNKQTCTTKLNKGVEVCLYLQLDLETI